MQLSLMFSGSSFALPINYRPLIHGLIYRALSADSVYSTKLHSANQNEGQNRAFKGFTFSSLQGAYTVDGRNIWFHNNATLEIRSWDEKLIRLLEQHFRAEKTVTLGSETLPVSRVEITDAHLRESSVSVRMLTPVVAYRTDENKHTVFFQPDEESFYTALIRNAERKNSSFQPAVPFQLQIHSLNDGLPRKQFSQFKKTYITGWYGTYRLEGTPEVIDLLYQVGLGAKNSEGFGMFTVDHT